MTEQQKIEVLYYLEWLKWSHQIQIKDLKTLEEHFHLASVQTLSDAIWIIKHKEDPMGEILVASVQVCCMYKQCTEIKQKTYDLAYTFLGEW